MWPSSRRWRPWLPSKNTGKGPAKEECLAGLSAGAGSGPWEKAEEDETREDIGQRFETLRIKANQVPETGSVKRRRDRGGLRHFCAVPSLRFRRLPGFGGGGGGHGSAADQMRQQSGFGRSPASGCAAHFAAAGGGGGSASEAAYGGGEGDRQPNGDADSRRAYHREPSCGLSPGLCHDLRNSHGGAGSRRLCVSGGRFSAGFGTICEYGL